MDADVRFGNRFIHLKIVVTALTASIVFSFVSIAGHDDPILTEARTVSPSA